MTHQDAADGIGLGFYAAADVARLVRLQSGERLPQTKSISVGGVHRLVRGYYYRYQGKTRFSPPLWKIDFPSTEGPLELSFRDLIELRFVKMFRDAGLGFPTIRLCFERAKEFIGDSRPFSTRQFRTDGKTIFLEITRDVSEGELIDLKRRQYMFRRVVTPSLQDLEFDADVVARWFPLGEGNRKVVIDPKRAFGRPIAAESGVPTQTLARATSVEKSVKEVARLYGVHVTAVRSAILFENKLAA